MDFGFLFLDKIEFYDLRVGYTGTDQQKKPARMPKQPSGLFYFQKQVQVHLAHKQDVITIAYLKKESLFFLP